jgi:hypothetical protein
MAKLLTFLALLLLLSAPIRAQEAPVVPAGYRNWPVVVGLQFHSLSMPLSDWKTSFSNLGLSLGTEFRYNRRATLLQSVQVGYYRNKYAGDGLFVAPQLVYRPQFGPLFAELKAGAGALYTMQPSQSLELQDGQWQTHDHGGKPTLMLPVGVSIGYNGRQAAPAFAPFVSYQVFVMHGYNPGVPVVPNRLLQIGFRSHLPRR